MTRYHNETLFEFIHRFPPVINELALASGKTFSESELKDLWKLNFVRHINIKESSLIKIHHDDYVDPTEWASIKDYNKGTFNFEAMNKLFTQMSGTLPKMWKPDNLVKEWNEQKRKDLSWDHEVFSTRPPKLIEISKISSPTDREPRNGNERTRMEKIQPRPVGEKGNPSN